MRGVAGAPTANRKSWDQARLGSIVDDVIAKSGVAEDELVREVTPKRRAR